MSRLSLAAILGSAMHDGTRVPEEDQRPAQEAHGVRCELQVAGIVINAIRLAKCALDRGIAGALEAPSAYLMKSPPRRATSSSASSSKPPSAIVRPRARGKRTLSKN